MLRKQNKSTGLIFKDIDPRFCMDAVYHRAITIELFPEFPEFAEMVVHVDDCGLPNQILEHGLFLSDIMHELIENMDSVEKAAKLLHLIQDSYVKAHAEINNINPSMEFSEILRIIRSHEADELEKPHLKQDLVLKYVQKISTSYAHELRCIRRILHGC